MTDLKYSVSAVLLAGGIGTRMNSEVPKQYLMLGDKAIARYSFDCLCLIPEISEIVVVCEEPHRSLFNKVIPDIDVSFAEPGSRRQDSVYNGCQAIISNPDLICIHDAARPFINRHLVKRVLDAADEYGAATAAMPIKFTVKEADEEQIVVNTPDRSTVWEIQTPQVLNPKIIEKGFDHVNNQGVTVTDDVSLAEQIGAPVKLVFGDYNNLKITTPEDLSIAEEILKNYPATEQVVT